MMTSFLVKCLLIFSLAFAASTLTAQNLTVKIANKTGHELDSLVIGSTFIRSLPKDSTTASLIFSQFHFDSGFPDDMLSAYINNNKIKDYRLKRCGTGLHTETKGTYRFDLEIQQIDGTDYLLLKDSN